MTKSRSFCLGDFHNFLYPRKIINKHITRQSYTFWGSFLEEGSTVESKINGFDAVNQDTMDAGWENPHCSVTVAFEILIAFRVVKFSTETRLVDEIKLSSRGEPIRITIKSSIKHRAVLPIKSLTSSSSLLSFDVASRGLKNS